ncbi:MAG: hypothetical protein ABIP41_01680 [Croceibacterium sp.]
MRIDPAIAALRADRGLQRQAQAATIAGFAAWRDEPGARAALAELAQFGQGAPLERCPALEALVTGPDAGGELAQALCRALATTLAQQPFGHPPLRHGFDGAVSTLQVAHAGRAHLVLHARESGVYSFTRAAFSDALRFEAVLAGSAEARIVRRGAGGLSFETLALTAGTRLALDLASEALQAVAVSRRLVSLRLHRFAAEPEPTHEYSLADGALAHRSSGNLAASRHAMIVAVLGRMERAEAAPVLAAIAREPGETSLRWEALREGLALDTAQGFAALLAVARQAGDPLSAAAGALRAQLIETHPQLAALEEPPCPA